MFKFLPLHICNKCNINSTVYTEHFSQVNTADSVLFCLQQFNNGQNSVANTGRQKFLCIYKLLKFML